jgi:prevent-host-death family protein
MRHMPLTDARAQLSELVDRVRYTHERIAVSKHGKPVAYLISAEDMLKLREPSAIRSPQRPSDVFAAHREVIREVVAAHHCANPRVFGSVLHGTDHEGSDLDILVDATSQTSLFDIGAIHAELRKRLGIPVDVLTPNSLPESFRAKVMAEATPI